MIQLVLSFSVTLGYRRISNLRSRDLVLEVETPRMRAHLHYLIDPSTNYLDHPTFSFLPPPYILTLFFYQEKKGFVSLLASTLGGCLTFFSIVVGKKTLRS